MSVKIMGLVWYADMDSSSNKFVLLALADRADDNGYCYPGVPNIVLKTSLSKSTVIRSLSALELQGWIETRHRRKGGHQDTNAYRINLAKLNTQQYVVGTKDESDLAELFNKETPGQDLGVTTTPSVSGGTSPECHGESARVSPRISQGVMVTPNTSVNTSIKTKTPVRTNGSVGARETSDNGEDQIEVPEPKSAPTREQDSAGVAVSSPVDAGSGVEDRELKPWQMRDYWGNVVKNPEYVATEEDIRWMTNYYIECGYEPDYAARFSRSQLMTPAQREAQQFLDSIDVELSVDEKREFYPLVTKLFGGSWQAGDLAQKLCWGLDGFGSPVAGFRKRLRSLVGGSGGLAAA